MRCDIKVPAMASLNKSEVVARIHARLRELDMAPYAASLKAGQNGLWWGRVAKHETQWPTTENLYALCDAIGLRISYALTGRGARLVEDPDISDDHTLVPRVSWVAAGGFAATETITPDQVEHFLAVAGLPQGDFIALDVVGDSMNLSAPENSVIIVNRRDRDLVDRKLYVVTTEDRATATFKRYRADWPPRLEPHSTNPEHQTIYLQGPLRVIGRVIKVMSDL